MFLLLNLSRYAFAFLSKICNFIPEFFASDSNELASVSFVVVLITNSCSVQNDFEADFSLFAADTFFSSKANLLTSIIGIAMFGHEYFAGLVLLEVFGLFLFKYELFPSEFLFFSNLLFLFKYHDIFSTISLLTSELTP